MDVFSLHFSTVVFFKKKGSIFQKKNFFVKNFKVGIFDVKLTELSESNIKFPGKCTCNKLYMVTNYIWFFPKKRAFFNIFFSLLRVFTLKSF